MNKLYFSLLTILLIFLLAACTRKNPWVAQAPAGAQYCQINRDGESIIPNGRIIKPAGKSVFTAPHPYGLVLSPDGKVAVTANSGNAPFSISVIRNFGGNAQPEVRQIPEGANNQEGILESVFMGLAITPDNRFVFVAGGQSNKIFKFDLQTGRKIDSLKCGVMDGDRDYTHGYIGDMILSKDGTRLYALDQIGFRLLVVDAQNLKLLHNIPTGRYPFGVTLSPDGQSLYVANVGIFEYKPLNNLDPKNLKETAADFPTSGFNTPEMREGYKKGKLDVPGLGDPNTPEGFSVWKYNLSEKPALSKKIKTGFLVGDLVDGVPAVGGASPNSLVATERYVFVSNGNNDCISVIDFVKDTVVKNIFLKPDARLGGFRGVIPFGLAISPDRKQLFVAESGINAVGVIDAEKLEVLGHIPTGWFPSKVAVTPDGKKLLVTSAKGLGSGPNGGKNWKDGPEGHYVGGLMKGLFSVIDMPNAEQLKAHTTEVIRQNYQFAQANDAQFNWRAKNPVPLFPGQKDSPIKHIVFISKENRTFDEVFSQVKGAKGDPTLARYGANQKVVNRLHTDSVLNATIMVNHLALAERFAISDNFYVDADHSADGHRWLVNTYPNEWVETGTTAAYGGKRSMRSNSKAPGNLLLYGASGAIYPEDYNEAGSMWDHLERNKQDFFNFGFGVELAAGIDDSTMKYVGLKYLVNYPVPGPLYERSSRKYATYNMAIPDQFRAKTFMEEFNEKFIGSGKTLPQVLTIILPNDHGAGERPQAGYPYRASYMADNDLALGRVVEFLSHTPYWKNMAIVVTEDDAQDGQDHIDAHRSLLMVISPYARRNHVGHQHYSFGSIFKTFWNILGIPYLNQYDAAASDLADLFTDQPDFTPYSAFPVHPKIFDPQKALTPMDAKFDWKAVIESPKLDNVEDFIKKQK